MIKNGKKYCKKCDSWKDIKEFNKDSRSLDELQYCCKECNRKKCSDYNKSRRFSVWHIDHILPISKFDLKNIEHQKICFHYFNLQPLWADENMKKGEMVVEYVEQLIDAILEDRKLKNIA